MKAERMTPETAETLVRWAETYNDRKYFEEDPIIFPTRFLDLRNRGICCVKDIEVAAVFAAHFAWGRRSMIVRDCTRLFDRMDWKPYDYVMKGVWKDDPVSVHRTIRWSDTAAICSRLREIYLGKDSLEHLSRSDFRVQVFGQKEDPKAPDKKINMMRRWLVRNDGKVDLGIWRDTDPSTLLIPLDVHVHDVASAIGLTDRRQKDITTVREITGSFAEIFPGDPCKGDFALFGYGVTHPR